MQICIHGDNGSGKSTLAKGLAKHYGFRHFSTGDFARNLALENGFDSIKDFMASERKKDQNFDIDDLIDGELKKELIEFPEIVIDSRMAFFFANKDAINLYCVMGAKTAAEWIWNGDKRRAESFQNVEEIERYILDRQKIDKEVLLEKYKTDYTSPHNFHLFIVSSQYHNQPDEMLSHAIKIIENFQENRKYM